MSKILELSASDAGGTWVTINGAHVLIKDGVVSQGPSGMKGKTVKELGQSGQHVSDVHGANHPETGTPSAPSQGSHQYAPAKGTAEYEDMKTTDPNRLRDQAMHDKFFANAPAGKEEAMAESIKSQAKTGTFSVFAKTPLSDSDKERLSAYRVVAHKNGYEIGPYKANPSSDTVTATIKKSSGSKAMSADNFVLSLDAHDTGTPMPLGLEGLPTKNAANEPIHYRRLLVAPYGDWTHRGDGSPVSITRERAGEWVKNHTALSGAGVKPWVTPKHVYDGEGNFATPDARDTLGYVERLEAAQDGLYAVVGLHGDSSLAIAARNSRSIAVANNDAKDAKGNVASGESLHHLALTPNPALPIAASADAPASKASIYTFASATHTAAPSRRSFKMKPELATQVRAKLGLGADKYPDDKLDDAVAEKALALSADLATVTTERDTAKQEAATKAQEVVALSADSKEPDALSMSLITRSFKTDRDRVIESGVISEAGMKEIDALLFSGNKPTKTALALSAGSPDPFYSRLCEIIRKNPGVKHNNQVERDGKPVTALTADPNQPDLMTEGKNAGVSYQNAQLATRGLK